MTKLTANQYRLLCSGVQYAIDSVASCLGRELPRERATLVGRITELRGATLARRNADCAEFAAMVLRRADEILARRPAPRYAVVAIDESRLSVFDLAQITP